MRERRVVRTSRFAERRRAVRALRTRRRVKVATLAAVALATGLGAWRMTASSLFEISSIEVVGARLVPAEKVLSASGLSVGQSALGVGIEDAERRIRAIDVVADARIERTGASLRIVVEERRPALAVRTPARTWLFDESGAPFAGVVPRAPGIPVLRLDRRDLASSPAPRLGAESEFLRARTGGSGDLPAVGAYAADALRLWRALPAKTARAIRWLEVEGPGNLAARAGTTVIVLGDASRMAAKMRALRLVRDWASARGLAVARVDLRAPDRPAATFR